MFDTKRFGAFDLKWVLVRRILLAAVLCVAVGAGVVLSNVANEARQRNSAVSDTISRVLKLQLVRIDSALDLPQRFPDWTAVVDFTLDPGQCVRFASTTGQVYSRCVGVEGSAASAPTWFSVVYESVFLRNVDTTEQVVHRTDNKGVLDVTVNRLSIAHQAWLSVSDMLRLSVALIAILCVLVYVVVDRALRPTADILEGLSSLAAGDLTVQLPRYRLRELDKISTGLNHLTKELQTTTSERAEFAKRLIETQERERRRIARELHDDVAQQLTAISGLSASISSTLGDQSGAGTEAKELVRVSGRAIRSLRDTLSYLRPQEIDELGLVASLDEMVAEHNRRARGKTSFTLSTSGAVDKFDADVSAHIYRLVQEGLNNAVKHAGATKVSVSLSNTGIVEKQDGSSEEAIELAIEDDGTGILDAKHTANSDSLGLMGMRERVSALGGRLDMGVSAHGGASLHVVFAVPRSASMP